MESENQQLPAYDAIIPAPVRYAKIHAEAKLLYAEIHALSRKEGYCYARNGYLSRLCDVSERSIRRYINQLEDMRFIQVELTRDEKKRITGRRIYLSEAILFASQRPNLASSGMVKSGLKVVKKPEAKSGLVNKDIMEER